MKKITASLFVFFLMIGVCESQSVTKLTGIVEIGFQKEVQTNGHLVFWKTFERILIGTDTLSLVLDVSDIVGQIDLVCQGDSATWHTAWLDQRKSLYEQSLFRDQTTPAFGSYDVHYGGKVYQNPTGDNLLITFKVKFAGIVYFSRPCEGFELNSNYTCPIPKKKKGYPLCVPIHIYKAKPIKSRKIAQKGLFKFDAASFYWLECD